VRSIHRVSTGCQILFPSALCAYAPFRTTTDDKSIKLRSQFPSGKHIQHEAFVKAKVKAKFLASSIRGCLNVIRRRICVVVCYQAELN
jgi:hypothetical protein